MRTDGQNSVLAMQGRLMRDLRIFLLFGIIGCIPAIRVGNSAGEMKPVPLPPVEGAVIGAAFSPDSSRLALIRKVLAHGTSGLQHVLQIIEIQSRQEIAHAEIFKWEPASLDSSTDFLAYSPDGRYLLAATKGSDFLFILDASSLQSVKQFALHQEAGSRIILERHHYFRGVIGLAVAAGADIFGVLTHDEMEGNEISVGSFSSGRIINKWSLGKGRAATQLGEMSISVIEDGSRIAVSLLPDQNSLPKTFNNVRVYNSWTGQITRSIRTTSLIGQISFISNGELLTSRVDTPGLFSKKVCLEKWNLSDGTLGGQFCDDGRNVNVTFAISLAANRAVGFASQIHRSIEGHVYAAAGRVDVWDMQSGNLTASSSDLPHLVANLKLSPSGEWLMVDQTLFQLRSVP